MATPTGGMATTTPPPGPPYAPQVAMLGGQPTVQLDVPIAAVFLFLFICGAAGHMTLLQVNLRRGHKFILNGLIFGFCMARIAALTMRIVWANRPANTSIAIAANVLTAAGVVILFVVNLIFAQRIVRSTHPNFGWHTLLHHAFTGFYVVLGVSLVLLIALTVTTFYTLDPNLRRVARDIQLYGQSAFLAICFLPIPLVLGAILVPRKGPHDKFGRGRFRTKVALLLFTATILSLGAAFRLGTAAMDPRPVTDPAWYHSKACYWLFNFTIEIIVALAYLFLRVDRRFHVPDGAHGPGSYRQPSVEKEVDDVGLSEETTSERSRERMEAQAAA